MNTINLTQCATAGVLLIPLWAAPELALCDSACKDSCLPLHPHLLSAAVLSEWLWSAGPPQTAPRYQCGWTHQSKPTHQSWARREIRGEKGTSNRSKYTAAGLARLRNYKLRYWGTSGPNIPASQCTVAGAIVHHPNYASQVKSIFQSLEGYV